MPYIIKLNIKQENDLRKLCKSYLISICNSDGGKKAEIHESICKKIGKIFHKNLLERLHFIIVLREYTRDFTDNLNHIYDINFGFEKISIKDIDRCADDLKNRFITYANKIKQTEKYE
jgi:hypothetical protein